MVAPLNHAERDARDAAYMVELRAISHPCQHERGGLMRKNLVRFYPHIGPVFAALPLLYDKTKTQETAQA